MGSAIRRWGAGLLMLAAMGGSTAARAAVISYPIDPASADIRFHTMVARVVPVDGSFTRFTGHILFDTTQPSAITIDVAVDDGAMVVPFGGAQTLRSAPYFDQARFPTIRFQSDHVTITGEDHFSVTGRVTIRGVTQTAVLVGQMSRGTIGGVPAIRVSATSALDRTAFGMVADRPLIADRVELQITARLRAP